MTKADLVEDVMEAIGPVVTKKDCALILDGLKLWEQVWFIQMSSNELDMIQTFILASLLVWGQKEYQC